MKKLIISLLIYIGMCFIPQQTKAQYATVNFQLFYDELSPYGMWVDNPTYGYVWVPNAGAGFSPYASEGYWVYTEWGWTWVSYYNWGWAPFHYGRWYYDPFYGYAWIPGNEWGPAWVSWRHCNGYYGWVPLGPGISFGVTYANYNPPAERWVFVRERDFGNRSANYVDRSTNITIIKNSTVINNTIVNKGRGETYIAGPDKADVQKFTGRNVKPVPVAENSKPALKMSNDKLLVYRPKVESVSVGRKPAPAKVYTASEAKPIIEKRGVGGQNQNPNKGRKDLQHVQNAPGAERRMVTPQKSGKENIQNTNPEHLRIQKTEPVQHERKAEPIQPQQRIITNEPKESTPENKIRPVQPRAVKPQIREDQPPQRAKPNPEPRMRNNEFRQSPPNNMQPVQPRMEPQQQPMQRLNPNQQPGQPHMNPRGGQRVPVQGPHKPH